MCLGPTLPLSPDVAIRAQVRIFVSHAGLGMGGPTLPHAVLTWPQPSLGGPDQPASYTWSGLEPPAPTLNGGGDAETQNPRKDLKVILASA